MSSDAQARPPPGLRRSLSPANRPSRPQSSEAATSQHQLPTTPIAQSQWTRIPLAYRPKDWVRSSFNSLEKPLPAPPSQSARPSSDIPPTSSYSHSRTTEPFASASRHSPPRRKPRPDQSLYLSHSAEPRISDANMTYPHTWSSYEPPMTSRSAPEDFQRASRDSDSPTLTRRPSSVYSPLSPSGSMLPRSPTYPPGTSKKHHNAGGADPAFQDEEEFRLFIDATTGLGPLPTFRQGSISAASALNTAGNFNMSHQHSSQTGGIPSVHIQQHVSPLEVTPPALYTPQYNAPMSHRSQPNIVRRPVPPRQHSSSQSRSQAQPQRRHHEESDDDDEECLPIDISDSGLGVFQSTTTVPPRGHEWLDTETPMPDDELPDYATSQAEAHAAQRSAATRRAQELQRRWQQGGRKYGSDY